MLGKIEIRSGSPFPSGPLGLSFHGDTAYFTLFSRHAERIFLGLFFPDKIRPEKEVPLNRTGDIWHVAISGFPEGLHYAFRCEGPYDPEKGLLFNSSEWLSDPYAKTVATPIKWGDRSSSEQKNQTKANLIKPKEFDWENDRPLKIPLQDLVIYEMHVRGFTQHLSSKVAHPGTFLGMIEKIPYLKKLGVNAVELMPIFEFDETHCKNKNPETGALLNNYWGYDPLHYFAPMRRYGASPNAGAQIEEFKKLVRELHKNGIEVILDVVYNHTGEEENKNYFVNFRGLDNPIYYQLDTQGTYRNFTGCGNTFNCNHPSVQQFILDSLRYWINEMHVDGFRFDLASILTRDQNGNPSPQPPILAAIASDPCISQVKLIAEAWDAAGLYQVGTFPNWGPWSEWNGRYRDVVRTFIKGTDGKAGLFGNILTGSEWIYRSSKTPLSSINFVTAHDGFSLRDLVTYQQKYNLANGENNRDGSNQNDSWNCGAEGPTSDPRIASLRERQMRNFLLALFLSQGVPMLLMGDEYGHTRKGNNNPYVQDNELNWFLWDELKKNQKQFDYVSSLIAFRKNHPCLRRDRFLNTNDIEWHGTIPSIPDWSKTSRFVAFSYKNQTPLYAAFNACINPTTITLPPNVTWRQLVHTAQDWDEHHLLDPEKGVQLPSQLELPPYSSLLALGHPLNSNPIRII